MRGRPGRAGGGGTGEKAVFSGSCRGNSAGRWRAGSAGGPRRPSRGSLFFCALLALPGCGGARKGSDAPLVVVIPSAPFSLVPNASTEDFTLDVLGNVYEGLVDLDGALRLRPGLAEYWYSPEDGTWVFHLRPGVRWHDGSPLLVQDVVDSIDLARRDPRSDVRSALNVVREVRAADASTIVIRSNEAFEALPLRLVDVLISKEGKGGGRLGTGPYRVSSSEGGVIRLEAYPGCYKGSPPISTVLFKAIPDEGERLRMIEKGTADLMVDVPAEAIPRLRGRLTVQSVKGLRVLILVLSCRDDPSNPFRDKRVRRAIAKAIDRGGVVARLGGFAQAVDRIASREELGGHLSDATGLASDPATAIEWLREAGYPQGFEADLDTAAKYRGLRQLLPELQRQLAAVNVRAHPKTHPSEAFVGLVQQQKSGMYLLGWLSDVGDSRVSYEDLVHSRSPGFGGYNGGAYADAETDRLIEEAARTPTSRGLDVIFDKLDAKLAEDVPLIPLLRLDDLYAFSPKLEFTPRLDRRLRMYEARWRP